MSCQSKVFRAACQGGFKEATSGLFEMPEDSLPIVQGMVDYLYTGSYDDQGLITSDEPPVSVSAAKFNARMFALADKYQIDGLRTLSASKYSKAIEEYSSLHLFFESIPEVYLTPDTARDLRDAALSFARRHLGTGLQIPGVKVAFEELRDDT
ncbi:hypothetical protein DL770_010359 [Monosporascus sp. CRB-9-2]|nr:hypothetical protein DL770_010359 [Monosporascus sp. CRB-9-2]